MTQKNDYVPEGPRDYQKEETATANLSHNPREAIRKLADPEWVIAKQDVAIIRGTTSESSEEPILENSPDNPNQVEISPGVDKA